MYKVSLIVPLKIRFVENLVIAQGTTMLQQQKKNIQIRIQLKVHIDVSRETKLHAK